ncbi:MFS transporter [Mucilaginibacter rubeus]|uniref:MFS transporter n=1 Tax=Mucilaginibacter rubeus TaxID=2027860 RepID=A0AAE6JF95_9SPHI|nr:MULTISPECIES: MFS transporter [Mucilaginibacter]QEM04480.1 MFS transporter [Mucilaginibacter rubeus]QEM17075.1 MFS transporter [Mucilaginibacter gossypii]QTE46425.1 MFS transporter [Mucilaginibacter rubeus]QTE53022.1 MFS transporter [Mucilaginibacter rubeus]QTE58109.1 MFS transporter [Mucilaginibacter rubeus]
MESTSPTTIIPEPKKLVQQTVYSILFTISLAHFINDMLQSVIPSIYPLIKQRFSLNFTQIGLITFTYQITASILQPFVGLYTDKKPKPYSLAIGMGFTLSGLMLASFAGNFYIMLMAVSLIGIGSSIFHPESSRVAHLASGGKKGLAQSIFQLGGNAGSAIGPLLAALIVIPYGQSNVIWFCLIAFAGILVLLRIAKWYAEGLSFNAKNKNAKETVQLNISKRRVIFSLGILLVLIFSKYFYLASITSYYTFFLINKFHLSIQQSQIYLFMFLGSVAAGTLFGGPLGDRFGRKYIIWISILGVAPFTMLLPYVSLFWTGVLSVFIGLILSSAFSAILVYATELVPGKVGLIAGLFFGLAFGMGGLGSAILGKVADMTSINYVFKICAYLPLIGIFTGLLPNIEGKRAVKS